MILVGLKTLAEKIMECSAAHGIQFIKHNATFCIIAAKFIGQETGFSKYHVVLTAGGPPTVMSTAKQTTKEMSDTMKNYENQTKTCKAKQIKIQKSLFPSVNAKYYDSTRLKLASFVDMRSGKFGRIDAFKHCTGLTQDIHIFCFVQ